MDKSPRGDAEKPSDLLPSSCSLARRLSRSRPHDGIHAIRPLTVSD
ncbi:MAG: hypothetical protein ACFB9N_09045 [Geitlerinemataceae cyanobacterium]